jgi:predicted RNA-binding protein with PUA-like domain
VVIVFTALIFIFVNAAVSESDFSIVLMPFYVVIVIALGIVCGIVHAGAAKRAAANPNKKYIDPRSRKGKRLLARQLEEEEYALRKYIDDDTIKKRRQQLEEEAEKNRKRKGE